MKGHPPCLWSSVQLGCHGVSPICLLRSAIRWHTLLRDERALRLPSNGIPERFGSVGFSMSDRYVPI